MTVTSWPYGRKCWIIKVVIKSENDTDVYISTGSRYQGKERKKIERTVVLVTRVSVRKRKRGLEEEI